jgi:hypothetical protein
MTLLTPELAERLAGYLVNRRDKRLITFGVLGLYAAALLYHLVGPALGAPAVKPALDSIEALALVVVVAHIAGSVAQRAVAVRGFAPRDRERKSERERERAYGARRSGASPASDAAGVASSKAAGVAP